MLKTKLLAAIAVVGMTLCFGCAGKKAEGADATPAPEPAATAEAEGATEAAPAEGEVAPEG